MGHNVLDWFPVLRNLPSVSQSVDTRFRATIAKRDDGVGTLVDIVAILVAYPFETAAVLVEYNAIHDQTPQYHFPGRFEGAARRSMANDGG